MQGRYTPGLYPCDLRAPFYRKIRSTSAVRVDNFMVDTLLCKLRDAPAARFLQVYYPLNVCDSYICCQGEHQQKAVNNNVSYYICSTCFPGSDLYCTDPEQHIAP